MRHKRKNKPLFFLLLSFSAFLTACGSTAGTAAPSPETAASPSSETAAVPAVTADYTSAGYRENTITVNSSEKVTLTPDIAEIIYAVRTEAKDASACHQKNTEDVSNVIELLKSLGIEESSIQTSDYYMYPIYNYSGNTQRITGYEASTSLTVSRIPIDNLGTILTKSVEAGINNIQSIAYMSSQYDEGYANALKLAMDSAKTKAAALAEAGGCSLGNVVGVTENSSYSEARYTDNALSAKLRSQKEELMSTADAAGEFSGIMPGEVEAEVNITVEYLIY
ncbi:MAG TPA: SIMPL domain-containing protein [Lachnospiraceae bacterium]|nr:SIMPL domain-containing protein [Lachnospiraceae bacterium]